MFISIDVCYRERESIGFVVTDIMVLVIIMAWRIVTIVIVILVVVVGVCYCVGWLRISVSVMG